MKKEYVEGYLIEADAHYVKKLDKLYIDLSFLPERMNIEKF